MKNQKVAVVIYNLGGPDGPDAIQPFLYNLFNDPFIISLPAFIRTPLAWLISTRRAPKVKPLYDMMGGRSPIQPHTLAQAAALEAVLQNEGNFKVFTSQRYWHPMVNQTAREIKAWGAERVMLLPLYPQFSTTTTESFTVVWKKAARRFKLKADVKALCCFPLLDGFVKAQARLVQPFLAEAKKLAAMHNTKVRILFSAHGLPEKIVNGRGDPYPLQVQMTADAIAAQLDLENCDWTVSFQSRVGPLKWIQPYTDKEIEAAAKDKRPIVIVPLSFVSDHLETLVELDIEYKHFADEHGAPYYGRVPTVYLESDFIAGLKDLVLETIEKDGPFYVPPFNQIVCPGECKACPHYMK